MIAALLMACAAALLVGGPPALGRLDALQPREAHLGPKVAQVLLGVAVPVCAGLAWGPRGLAWATAATIVIAVVWWLTDRTLRERARRVRAAETAQLVMALSLLLRAGRVPSEALQEVARDCPALAPAVAAANLGADAAGALQVASEVPGREGFGHLASAWRVAERMGAPVAAVLARVAEGLRAEDHLRGVVDAELSMARNSARVMAVLPFFALGMGFLVGGNPVAFLIGNPLGCWLVLAAVTLAAAGLVWTEKMGVRT